MYAKLCYGQAGSIIMKLLIMGESFGCCAAHLKVFGETVQSILVLFFNFKNIQLFFFKVISNLCEILK